MKIYKLAFRLHSLSVTFVTPTCSLSLSNYVTMLAANSVSLKDLISGCDCIISSSRLHIISEEISLVVSLILSGWTCSGRFCAITVSTVHLQNLECVENLYSKCAVLLCSWMWQALCRPLSSSRQQYMFTVWLLGWVGERQLQICVFYSLRIFLFVRQHLKTREVRNVSSIRFLTQSNCGKNT